MIFMFKCGSCGHKYTVDTERVKTATIGKYCPNCEAQIPADVLNFARTLANMGTHPNAENWELFLIPDEVSTSSACATFHAK